MGNSTRVCKVCGKEYPYCKTELKNGEIFRWQDVACCVEHGSEYFALIAASRGTTNSVTKEAPVPSPVVDDELEIEEDIEAFEDDEEDDGEEDGEDDTDDL